MDQSKYRIIFLPSSYCHPLIHHQVFLKGQCHGIFDTFLLKKTPPWSHMNWQKQFCEDIREKLVSEQSKTTRARCQRSQRLHGHDVSVVNDYRTLCQRSQRLCRHCVSVVSNCADTCQHSQRLRGYSQGLRGHRVSVVVTQ